MLSCFINIYYYPRIVLFENIKFWIPKVEESGKF